MKFSIQLTRAKSVGFAMTAVVVALAQIFVVPRVEAAGERKPSILIVSPEQTGVLQTGGLAHATGDLALGLNQNGYPTEVLMPGYVKMNAHHAQAIGERIGVDLDYRSDGRSHKHVTFSVDRDRSLKNPTVFLRHETRGDEVNFFDNVASGGKNYGHEYQSGESFGAFCKAAAEYILAKQPDMVILNDWTTGLIALHLKEAKEQGRKVPEVLFAIHNIAYQGVYSKGLADFLGLNSRYFSIDGFEFHGQMSFLKAGLQFSDMIMTVSPQYAQEIATPRFGAGLDGVIRQKQAQNRVAGILNGIINDAWAPHLPKEGLVATFTRNNLAGKQIGKAALQAELGLPQKSNVPLFVLTSRLAEQKGLAYLIDAVERTVAKQNSQWIISGDGDAGYVAQLKELERRFPDHVRFRAFSNELEKKCMRYGDFFVNGAWFEPSGLNQFFALINGTVPVVSRAGGLIDSVQHGSNGLSFDITPGAHGEPYDRESTIRSAAQAFDQAVETYLQPQKYLGMQVTGMRQDHSWNNRIQTGYSPLINYVMTERYHSQSFNGYAAQQAQVRTARMCESAFMN